MNRRTDLINNTQGNPKNKKEKKKNHVQKKNKKRTWKGGVRQSYSFPN